MTTGKMTYEEALGEINNRLVFGVKPGLERVTRLLELLGNPQEKLKCVHVAGTNGKGTTCTLIASALRESGLKTGLYISPYVLDFRERFQIDGEMIPKDELIAEVEQVAPLADQVGQGGEPVTEFEFITALALDWFARKGCGAVVLEVGLGGRFDATNVIPVPEAAVIMSISLDHTAILGDTVEQIAFEKAGIIKPGGRVVLYPEQRPGVREVVEQACTERGAELTVPDLASLRVGEATVDGTVFSVDGLELRTPFLGEHQVKNALTAYTALKLLAGRGFPVTEESIRAGFAKAFIPARMEILSHRPLTILDGGHNPGCAQALRDALRDFAPEKRKIAVIGMCSDKDSHEALRIVGPLFEKIITVSLNHPRGLPAVELRERAREFCKDVSSAETCGEALARAFRDITGDDALVVCGSFFLAEEIRDELSGKVKNLQNL